MHMQAVREFTPNCVDTAFVVFDAVSFNGRTHKVQVKAGAEGAKAFETEIRKMLQLPEEQEFDVSPRDCVT